MKQLISSSAVLLIGDDAAELLMRYAVLLGRGSGADSVKMSVIEVGGSLAEVTLLLSSGLSLAIASVLSEQAAPDNSSAQQYMIAKIAQLERTRDPSIEDVLGPASPRW